MIFLSLYEGVFRKWILPSLGTPIIALKFFLCIIFSFLCIRFSNKLTHRDFSGENIILIYVLYILGMILVSLTIGSLFEWAVGVLNYLGYVMLIIGVPIVLNNERRLENFIDFLIITLLISVTIGYIQFNLPSSHWLNQYSETSDYISMAGEHVRIASIFNYITAFGLFLTLLVPITLARALTSSKKSLLVFYIFLILLSLFCVFATGSRIVVLQSALSCSVVFFIYILKAKSNFSKWLVVFIVLVIGSILLTYWSRISSVESFTNRVNDINDNYNTTFLDNIIDRIYWAFSPVINVFNSDIFYNLVGRGPGSLNSYFKTVQVSYSNYIVHRDQPLSTTIYEIGLIGTIIYSTLLYYTFFSQLKKVMLIKNTCYLLMSVGVLLSLCQYLSFISSMSTNWFASFHYWLVIGLVIAIRKVDEEVYDKKKHNI